MGKRAVLLVDKTDGALPVPVAGIVGGGGQPGIAGFPEGYHHHKGRQNQTQHGGGDTVTEVARQPAALPQAAAGTQQIDTSEEQPQRGEPQQGKLQRPGHIGRDAGDSKSHRILSIGAAVPAGLQHQHARIAGQVQADGVGARRLGRHLPAAETDQLAIGLVGALHGKGKGTVRVERVSVVVGEVVQMKIVDGPVHVEKTQVGTALLQGDGAVAPLHIDVGVQVVHELERLIAVGVEVGHIADKQFRAGCQHCQQRQHEPGPPASEVAEPCCAEPCPAGHGREGRQAEPVKAHREAGAVEGAQRKQPDRQPEADGPAQIPSPDPPPDEARRQQPEEQRHQRRRQQCRNDHTDFLSFPLGPANQKITAPRTV